MLFFKQTSPNPMLTRVETAYHHVCALYPASPWSPRPQRCGFVVRNCARCCPCRPRDRPVGRRSGPTAAVLPETDALAWCHPCLYSEERCSLQPGDSHVCRSCPLSMCRFNGTSKERRLIGFCPDNFDVNTCSYAEIATACSTTLPTQRAFSTQRHRILYHVRVEGSRSPYDGWNSPMLIGRRTAARARCSK
ncbi:hypothetical protein BJY04DRAFT_12266 [Aspergillus karnatakaensis]|uniref:uncharacterized protein n=1 Tax=Aspergillus karnatakaensis TaxID=1810916 RepID=UPI003CCC96C3